MSNDKLTVWTATEEQMAIISEQLEMVVDEDFSPFSMPELMIPKAPAKKWDLDDKQAPAVRGVIVCWQTVRAYYATEFTGGNEPPDCSSRDGKTGNGEPGGICKNCPFAQWGSAKNNGQACSQRMHILFLAEGSILPIFLNLPPSSLGAFKNYTYGLCAKALPMWGVVTELTLTPQKNAGGIDYNMVEFSNAEVLPEDAQERIKEMRATFGPMLAARPVVEPPIDVNKYTE